MALAFVLFEELGGEYFSWWYVQHNVAIWDCMHLYSIFNLQLFLFILFDIFNLVLKHQTEMVNG